MKSNMFDVSNIEIAHHIPKLEAAEILLHTFSEL